CEETATAEVLQAATADRRLAKAHVSVHMGGATAAVAHYQESPTPNLIIVETSLPRGQMLAELDRLAHCCDAGTKVVVVGRTNDVVLYRDLLRRGVSEYLIAPITPLQLIESLSNLYNNPDTDPVGNVIAFIGAKGGVGSSTVCHNTAWAMSELLKSNVVVADFDLVLEVVRQNVPYVAVDLPHTWTPWVKRVLFQADEIVITVAPDLANLRNAKNLIDLLKHNRANDGPSHRVINMGKTPKRPEISAKEWGAAL